MLAWIGSAPGLMRMSRQKTLRRFEDWPGALAIFLESRRSTPFEWGRNDCVLFALDGVQAITGLDAAADIRGKYSTALGAAKRMKTLYGHPSLSEAATNFAVRWGGQEISTTMAGRGDIVLFRSEARISLGLCVGRYFVGAGVACMISVPMKLAERAWRV